MFWSLIKKNSLKSNITLIVPVISDQNLYFLNMCFFKEVANIFAAIKSV